MAARVQFLPKQTCHTCRASRNATPGASFGKLRSQASWTQPPTLPESALASRFHATFRLTARTRTGIDISRNGCPAGTGDEVGRCAVMPTAFRAASASGDRKSCAGPSTSPKAEIGTEGKNGICEFATDRVSLQPLPVSVKIAESRCWWRLPAVMNKACGQQQPRENRAKRQCRTQSKEFHCNCRHAK